MRQRIQPSDTNTSTGFHHYFSCFVLKCLSHAAEHLSLKFGKSSVSDGGYCSGATPVPIPNTEVKSACADGTAWATVWESRTPPSLTLDFVLC